MLAVDQRRLTGLLASLPATCTDLRAELIAQQQWQRKMELEGLHARGFGFLAREYLPAKLGALLLTPPAETAAVDAV